MNIVALPVRLRRKGEVTNEIVGFVKSMRVQISLRYSTQITLFNSKATNAVVLNLLSANHPYRAG